MNRKNITFEDAKSRLESLCARSEQCPSDLRRKFYNWGIPPSKAELIIEHLIDSRYIDEIRFARAFVLDKFRFSRWGRIKISHALRVKQISRNIIDSSLSEIDEDEYIQTLTSLLRAKSQSITEPLSYDGKTRLFRFAISRGFEPALVIETINREKWITTD